MKFPFGYSCAISVLITLSSAGAWAQPLFLSADSALRSYPLRLSIDGFSVWSWLSPSGQRIQVQLAGQIKRWQPLVEFGYVDYWRSELNTYRGDLFWWDAATTSRDDDNLVRYQSRGRFLRVGVNYLAPVNPDLMGDNMSVFFGARLAGNYFRDRVRTEVEYSQADFNTGWRSHRRWWTEFTFGLENHFGKGFYLGLQGAFRLLSDMPYAQETYSPYYLPGFGRVRYLGQPGDEPNEWFALPAAQFWMGYAFGREGD